MKCRYTSSRSPLGEVCHEVVLSYEFGHIHVELPTREESLSLIALLTRAKFVSASGVSACPELARERAADAAEREKNAYRPAEP